MNLRYEDQRSVFNKLYTGFYGIPIDETFYVAQDGDSARELNIYHKYIGAIISHIYLKYAKEKKLDQLIQSSDAKIKGLVESQESKKDLFLIQVIKVLGYLDYAKQIWDLGLGKQVEGKLSDDQKEAEQMIINLYVELKLLISL